VSLLLVVGLVVRHASGVCSILELSTHDALMGQENKTAAQLPPLLCIVCIPWLMICVGACLLFDVVLTLPAVLMFICIIAGIATALGLFMNLHRLFYLPAC
jgi:hypothetical protein